MRTTPFLLAGVVLPATAAGAAPGTISVTLPQPAVAEYHKPYVAGWVEPAGGGAARTLFVWYDVRKKGSEAGAKWLSEMRAWWRKGGRSLALPANGVSGATRPPGTHQVPLPADLPAGAYTLHVEAARENGGRELVSLPLAVPVRPASAAGHSELGTVTVR